MTERKNEPRPGGGSRYTSAKLSEPPPADVVLPSKPPRTESGAQRSLTAHYRRVIGEETANVRIAEDELRELRNDPKVVRYLAAKEALERALERRASAARDLGLTIAGEKPDGR